MTGLLNRLGAIESRLASAICSPGPAKRRQWVCADCRAKGAQRRWSSIAANYEQGTYQHSHADGVIAEDTSGSFPAQEIRRSTATNDVDASLDVRGIAGEALEQHTVRRVLILSPLRAIAPDTFDYRAQLPRALRRKDADLLIRAYIAGAEDADFISSIPATTFTESLELVCPEDFVNPFKKIHAELSKDYVRQLGVQPISEMLVDFMEVVQFIITSRKMAGNHLGAGDYKLLLKSAAAVGRKDVARAVWNEMHKAGFMADIESYNYLYTSIVWHLHHRPDIRQKVRVTRPNLLRRMRQRHARKAGINGYTFEELVRFVAGFGSYRVGKGGMKKEVTTLFATMLKNGVLADEETFTLMMTALSREGDLKGVKDVLQRVWNIDVDGLMAGKPVHKLGPVKSYAASSPLHPTERLLSAIAHTFGTNNEIPTALRTVDFVARSYNLAIPTEVWEQLFEWTFTASVRRYGREVREGFQPRRILPAQSVEDLWNTMVAEPYNIKPTAGMYNRLISSLSKRQRWGTMMYRIEEGRILYTESVKAAYDAYQELRLARLTQRQRQVASQSLGALQRRYDQLRLIARRNHTMVRRWVRLFLGQGGYKTASKQSAYKNEEWAVRVVPDFLNRMWRFLPRQVRYTTPTGRIQFKVRTTRQVKWANRLRGREFRPPSLRDDVRRFKGP